MKGLVPLENFLQFLDDVVFEFTDVHHFMCCWKCHIKMFRNYPR